jgi:hypothetical protein
MKGPLILHSMARPSTTAGRTRMGGSRGTAVKCIQRALGTSPNTLRVAPFLAVPTGLTCNGLRSPLAYPSLNARRSEIAVRHSLPESMRALAVTLVPCLSTVKVTAAYRLYAEFGTPRRDTGAGDPSTARPSRRFPRPHRWTRRRGRRPTG